MADDDICCECFGIHEDRIAEAVKCLPENGPATGLSDFFKVCHRCQFPAKLFGGFTVGVNRQ